MNNQQAQSPDKKKYKRLQGSSYIISLDPKDILGQGSFGKVVRAYDTENKQEQLVAKVMETNTNSKIESLKQELKVLEAFQSDHHNLVKYKRYKLFSSKAYYIIMEYCNGGTLEDKFNKVKYPSEIEIVDFLSQFASGYRELYHQNIIHRDIKPANILIHNRIYKIADFGLAKVIDRLNEKLALSIKGTPLYMAPELIKEEARNDPKVDMWSLGVILYRMLFGGSYPFLLPNKKYNKDIAFNDILKNDLTIPKMPRRSKDLVNLVKKMLEKDPAKRLSWVELFQMPLITLQETQKEDDKLQYSNLMTSSIFYQEMMINKVSQIKINIKGLSFQRQLKIRTKYARNPERYQFSSYRC